MKKTSPLLMVLVVMFLAFGTGTAKANEYFASELLKERANHYCGFVSLVNTSDEKIQNQGGFSNQTAMSKTGSKIILPFVPYEKYGYCHMFRDHMEKSNGTLKNKIGSKTQFKYAYGSEKTMKIAMEVINLQINKEPDGVDRYTKEIKSPTEGQVVKVVLNRTYNFAGGVYSGHDYVIVSMYTVF